MDEDYKGIIEEGIQEIITTLEDELESLYEQQTREEEKELYESCEIYHLKRAK